MRPSLAPRISLLLVAIATSCGVTDLAHAQWSASSLHPAGAQESHCLSVRHGQQVGSAMFGGQTHAGLWRGTAASWIDLHPTGATRSWATETDAGRQVGYAMIDGHYHASVWSGTGATWVDLHPIGAINSFANGISSGQAVGYAEFSDHLGGILWNLDCGTWVDLTPAGANGSQVVCVSSGQQFGAVWYETSNRQGHWNSSAASWELLDPVGHTHLEVFGLGSGQQVGFVTRGNDPGHACLLYGSIASLVDLNPVGASGSFANSVFSGFQSGFAGFNGVGRAGVWSGTAESWQDLSVALPGSWESSSASGVWGDATTLYVAGSGVRIGFGRNEAVLWTSPRPLVCIADMDDGTASGQPDGGVTIDDLLYFLVQYSLGIPRADVDDGSSFGIPDGGVTIDDLLYYLLRFAAGC